MISLPAPVPRWNSSFSCALLGIVGLSLFGLVGCGAQRAEPTSYSYSASQAEAAWATPLGSLFPADTAVIGNEAVTQILDTEIILKDEGRMGVLPIGSWMSRDAGLGAAHLTLLETKLAPSAKIGAVDRIPRLLLPERLTIPAIREVAARLRCETVLIYQTYVTNNYRSKVFGKDHLRTLITVEAVVLHTRTGTIPCSVIVDRDVDAKQQSGESDWDFARRAEAEAVASALDDIATRIRTRLE